MSTEIEGTVEATTAAAPQGMRKNGMWERVDFFGGGGDERVDLVGLVCQADEKKESGEMKEA